MKKCLHSNGVIASIFGIIIIEAVTMIFGALRASPPQVPRVAPIGIGVANGNLLSYPSGANFKI
jgi:hypothetical protein